MNTFLTAVVVLLLVTARLVVRASVYAGAMAAVYCAFTGTLVLAVFVDVFVKALVALVALALIASILFSTAKR